MPLEATAVGTVEAYSTVAVRAQVTGEMKSVNFQQGDDVDAGQVLFVLDTRPLEAALNQAAKFGGDAVRLGEPVSDEQLKLAT